MRPEDFSVAPYKASGGTWYPQYSYGYGSKWVSGWNFKPDTPASASAQPKAAATTPEEPVVTKKPKPVLGSTQAQASAGDTVPIVFGLRTNDIGGVWVQPSLVKTGAVVFDAISVFAVSQGDIAGTHDPTRMWVGNRNITYSKLNPIIVQDYIDPATAEANPSGSCPLSLSTTGIGKIYCDYDAFSFTGNTLTASGGTVRQPDIANNYYNTYEITKGTGDTNNSVIRYNNTAITVHDSATGNDVTSAYWAYLGINPIGTYTYINAVYSGSTIIGGWDVGVVRASAGSVSTLLSPTGPVPYSTGPVVFAYDNGTLIKQINPALPADTGTLWGVSQQWKVSPYANPLNPPSTKDFTNYSDITWLTIQGDLYDPNVDDYYTDSYPAEIPTEFKQLSIWYNLGVTVDLYSSGLVGGVYLSGASSYFVDLAMYLFTLMKRANGIFTDSLAAPIDTLTLNYLAAFNFNEELFFNGVVDQSINVIEYISQTAPYFFLSFISSGGQYSLKPAVPLAIVSGLPTFDTSAQTSTFYAVFDENLILPGSYQKKYFNAEDRRPVCISVLWRDADPAVVSKQQTTVVRYPETPTDAPTVQFDMTDFCVTQAHAVKYAKYELARRRYSTHSISFATQLGTITGFEPTDIIKVQRQRINSRGDNRTETGTYQITKLTHTNEGVTLIEAAYFPLNSSDIYTINNEIVNGTFTIT
jgi:hypothetical protein